MVNELMNERLFEEPKNVQEQHLKVNIKIKIVFTVKHCKTAL